MTDDVPHRTEDLLTRLRQYDKHNHRGQYAKLVHEAADELQKVRGLLELAKEEHYCGANGMDGAGCSSPFCKAMAEAGE